MSDAQRRNCRLVGDSQDSAQRLFSPEIEIAANGC